MLKPWRPNTATDKMADKKPKNFTGVTPKGIARYPALVEPDYGNETFPKPDGEYKTQLILTEAEAEPLIAALQPIHDQAVELGKAEFAKLKVDQRKKLKELTVNDLFTLEYDKETEEPTGNLIFKFSSKASGVSKKTDKKWERKVALFDAKGKPLKGIDAIWGGSVIKVSYEASPYFIPGTGSAGVKLHLNAVQVIELRSGSSRDAGGYGFGEEEGYEHEDSTEEEDTPFKEESGSTSDF